MLYYMYVERFKIICLLCHFGGMAILMFLLDRLNR